MRRRVITAKRVAWCARYTYEFNRSRLQLLEIQLLFLNAFSDSSLSQLPLFIPLEGFFKFPKRALTFSEAFN